MPPSFLRPFLLGVPVAVLLLGCAGTIAHRAEPRVQMAAGMTRNQQDKLDEMASASLFGQFRSSMSDFLWLKVDKYLHSGVDMRGLTPLEKEGTLKVDRVGNAQGKDAEGQRAHTSETTVVPSAQLDWRGPLGEMERQIRPYKDMGHHTHRDPKEALPLFRLMTLSNPHFIAGYTTGAAMIARDHTKYNEALTFLLEGENNNPESIEIEAELGMMQTANLKDFSAALPYLQHALRIGAQKDQKTLTPDESEAYQNAFRWLVLNRREAGDKSAARAAAQAGLRLFPDDIVCLHYLQGKKAEAEGPKGVD